MALLTSAANTLQYFKYVSKDLAKGGESGMKRVMIRSILGLLLCSAAAAPVLWAAEETAKTIPELLIKGEVEAVDTTDPAENILKVKDRYGFTTPIGLSGETKIMQGDKVVTASDLAVGATVKVRYSFDVNTAKRHAISVEVEAPAKPAEPAASSEAAPTESTMAPSSAAPVAPMTGTGVTPEAPATSPSTSEDSAPATTPQ